MLIIGCDYHPGFQQIAFVDALGIASGWPTTRDLAHQTTQGISGTDREQPRPLLRPHGGFQIKSVTIFLTCILGEPYA